MMELTKIGLLLSSNVPYYRQIIRGVVRYARPNRPWLLSYLAEGEDPAAQVKLRNFAAVLGAVSTPALSKALCRVRCPVVNVSNAMAGVPFPTVCTDNESVGRQAAEHFLDRGFQLFSFVGHHLEDCL